MKPFGYLRPTSVFDAAGALAEHVGTARVIAGGQSLLLAMKDRLETPSLLVSLQDVPEVRGIRYSANRTLTVGAATTYRQLESCPLDGAHLLLSEVAGDIADVPVRRMGTVGGALCQADPGFDFPLAALVSDAQVELVSRTGKRKLPVSEFLLGGYVTALQPGEVLTTIEFPAAKASARIAFVKHRLRRVDAAIASVACVLSLDGRKVTDARIACGAVGPVPTRLTASEEVIVGNEPDEDVLREAGRSAIAAIEFTTKHPMLRQEYKREVLPALVSRAIAAAVEERGPV